MMTEVVFNSTHSQEHRTRASENVSTPHFFQQRHSTVVEPTSKEYPRMENTTPPPLDMKRKGGNGGGEREGEENYPGEREAEEIR